MKPRGDRFGGVVFDIQQHRKGEKIIIPSDNIRAVQREKLIHVISTLITMVEEIDDLEFTNPRIGTERLTEPYNFNSDEARAARMAARDAGYERCKNIEHDRCGQRKTDCTECFPPGEQASLTTSLSNLNEIPVINTDVHMRTLHDDREPRMHATICACEEPNCNSDSTYPKACYSCGGLVVKK